MSSLDLIPEELRGYLEALEDPEVAEDVARDYLEADAEGREDVMLMFRHHLPDPEEARLERERLRAERAHPPEAEELERWLEESD